MKHFDLTKRETLSKAIDFIQACNPVLALGKFIFDKVFGENPSPEEQRKTAIALISEGKKQGVEEMEIEMDSGVAAKLGGEVEGVPIKIKGRMGNKVKMKVKYK